MKARLIFVRDRLLSVLSDGKNHANSFSRSEKAFWAVVFAALGILFLTILQLAGQGSTATAEGSPTELRVLATMDTTKNYTFPEIKEVPQEVHDSESTDGFFTVPKSALRIPTTTAEQVFEVDDEAKEASLTSPAPPKTTPFPESTLPPTTTTAPTLTLPSMPLPIPTTVPQLPEPPEAFATP